MTDSLIFSMESPSTLIIYQKNFSLKEFLKKNVIFFVNRYIFQTTLNLHPLKNNLKRRGTWCFCSVFSQLEPIDIEWRHELRLPRCSVNWLHPRECVNRMNGRPEGNIFLIYTLKYISPRELNLYTFLKTNELIPFFLINDLYCKCVENSYVGDKLQLERII